MKAEKLPITQMESRKTNLKGRSDLVNQLITLIEKIRGQVTVNRDNASFRELKATFNDEIVDVTLDKKIAQPGSWQFGVDRMARKSSAMSGAFDDPKDIYLGVGYVQYTLPDGSSKEVYIDEKNSNLDGIAKIINGDNSNGLQATVVDDGYGNEEKYRLVVALQQTGDEFNADFPYFYFVDPFSDLYLDGERGAHDAQVRLEGFPLETPQNKTSDLIPGVNIQYKKPAPGEEFTILITEDAPKVIEKVKGIVESINEVLKFIIDQNSLDKDSNTANTLGGDVTLQTLESRLRSLIFQYIPTSGGNRRIGDYGVEFKKDGLLKLDENKLSSEINKDWKPIGEFFTGYFNSQEGFEVRGFLDYLDSLVTGSLRRPDGILQNRKLGIQTKIRQIDDNIARRERILEQKETNLKNKFSRLESTISRIRAQGQGLSAITQQAADPVQKLG